MSLVQQLEAIEARVRAGELDDAVEQLVTCWRQGKQPELAAAIEAWAKRLSQTEPPASGGKGSARAVWLATSEKRRTASLPRLLTALPEATGPYAAERIETLEHWKPNPLIAARITRWLEDCPFENKARRQCMVPALEVLKAHADRRCIPALLRCQEDRRETILRLGLPAWKPLVALIETSARWPVPSPLTKEETAALTRLQACIGGAAEPNSLEPLWKRVFESPKDETARLVLSDALQERKDPRGEFIALQLARARTGGKTTARERELQQTWQADWLGPLHAVLTRDVEFARGFPVAGRVVNTGLPDAAAEWPQWATFERLDGSNASAVGKNIHPAVGSPHARSLREVDGMGEFDFTTLAKSDRPLPLETLRLNVWNELRVRHEFRRPEVFPKLTRFGLTGAYSPSSDDRSFAVELLDTPLGARLRALELKTTRRGAAALFDLARERTLDEAVSEVIIGLTLRYLPATARLVVEVDKERGDTDAALRDALGAMRKTPLSEVVLQLPARLEHLRAPLEKILSDR
ncbi:MAG: TIGR02996 domain-containing protein [Myxococcaceae bacterium]